MATNSGRRATDDHADEGRGAPGVETAHVLVVDDEAAVRTLIAMILEDEGYDVMAVNDGEQALRALEQEPMDAVVLDLDMPRMDGRECLRRMRARGVTVPVVIVSSGGARRAARELGADASVDKPFDPLDLLTKLEALRA